MHMEEHESLMACDNCGAEIWPERDRGYVVGPNDVLCFECAVARGGVFDEVNDQWVVSPELSELPIASE